VTMKTSEHHAPGDRVIVTVSADELGGGLLQFEYICRSVTSAPNDHVHLSREESVEVLEGTLHCRAGGQERVLRPGERVVIAAGTPHALWNQDLAGCRAVAEHRRVAGAQPRLEDYFIAAALDGR